ncbi:hypothetical protein HAX54_030928 [Datura stramonium]|uniref:Uncharacterized protein n=1 Tax=Datura stramonium TaxID=4076 RepID=A0ABS8SBG4_DATST|nr:hypothetical protein [Datura stramonium]
MLSVLVFIVAGHRKKLHTFSPSTPHTHQLSPENRDSAQFYGGPEEEMLTRRRNRSKERMKIGENDGTSKAAAAAAEDDEVEEFYAISEDTRGGEVFREGKRRGGGAGRNSTAEKPWNSYFRQEDFGTGLLI